MFDLGLRVSLGKLSAFAGDVFSDKTFFFEQK